MTRNRSMVLDQHSRRYLARASGALLSLALGLVWLAPPASVAAPDAQGNPPLRIAITSPSSGSVLQERVSITGWAVEPASRDDSAVNPRDLQLWLGEPGAGGRLLDYARYGVASADAAEFFGATHRDSGFTADWDVCSFPSQPYEIWAGASNDAGTRAWSKVDVSVAPCQRGVELYRADWSDSAGGRNQQAEQGKVGDAWSIRLLQPGGSAAGVEGTYCDALIELTAQLAGEQDGYYFVDFRIQPGPGNTLTDSFYRFSVHAPSGRYRLGLSQPGPEPIEDLVTWTASPAIRRGTQPNHLAVAVDGKRLRLAVNGTVVTEIQDDTYRWGKIRFGAATGDDRTTEVLFREFVITSLQGGT